MLVSTCSDDIEQTFHYHVLIDQKSVKTTIMHVELNLFQFYVCQILMIVRNIHALMVSVWMESINTHVHVSLVGQTIIVISVSNVASNVM